MTVEQLQRRLNEFFKNARLGYPPLRVDGRLGFATEVRIRQAKIYLGYLEPVNDTINDLFEWRLENPTRTSSSREVSRADVQRGVERRRRRRRAKRANDLRAMFKPGVGRFDGVPVAKPLIPYLAWARAHGWNGWLVSGWRSPAYSESLCMGMCGRPSCPGRCAGRSSRHSQITLTGAAADVAHYEEFGDKMDVCPYRPRLRNALGPRDPVHFSVAGN